MKKFICILISILFCFSFASCSKNTTKNVTKHTFSKEFSYLPSYSGDVELQGFTPPSKATEDYGTAKYIVKNTNNNNLLQTYESILKKDGWTIYEDKKPTSIAAKKDVHQIALIPEPNGSGDVILTVVSK